MRRSIDRRTATGGFMRQWLRLKQDRRGVAAVEFAFIVPVMLLLYFGVIEITQGFTANRKLVLLARALADLTTQATANITNGSSSSDPNDLSTVFGAAGSVFYPFSGSKMAITSVRFVTASDGVVRAFTVWSYESPANSGMARPCGELARTSVAGTSPPAVPDGLFVDGTSAIVADAAYTYLPLSGPTFKSIGNNGVGAGSVASLAMAQSAYMQPRLQNYIDTGSTKCTKPAKWPATGPSW